MVEITNHTNYVKIDLSAFASLEHVTYTPVYLMKDQSISVKKEKNGLFVLIITHDGSYQLDMAGINGFPAKVDDQVPTDNQDLAQKLADLKNL